jgi:hypothetical protein
MAVKKDKSASSLAENMIRALLQRKANGASDGPLTLEQLSRLVDPAASTKTVLAAVLPQRKAFGAFAIVARTDMAAPISLLEDLPSLAASTATLLYALQCNRTPSNHVASPSELKSKLTSKLKKPFQDAVNRLLAEDRVPEGVGWLLVRNTKKLFLLSDLHVAGKRRPATGDSADRDAASASRPSPCPSAAAAPLVEFAPTFDDAFARLDRQGGGHNFVSLMKLRQRLPLSRERFDAELRALRIAGRYTLSAAEGRHGLTTAEREASILENGTLFLYVSRKSP